MSLMVKVLTYVNNIYKGKGDAFARKIRSSNNKTINISAEEELGNLVAEGWEIVSSSSHTFNPNILGSTILIVTELVVILKK